MNNYGLVVKNTKKTGSVGWNMEQEDVICQGNVTGTYNLTTYPINLLLLYLYFYLKLIIKK